MHANRHIYYMYMYVSYAGSTVAGGSETATTAGRFKLRLLYKQTHIYIYIYYIYTHSLKPQIENTTT